jgi:hypothetical protein
MPPFPHLSPEQQHQSLDTNMVAQMPAQDIPQAAAPSASGGTHFGQQQSTPNKRNVAASPQQNHNMPQPGMGHYSTQQQHQNNMWNPAFDGLPRQDQTGQSPSDSWSTGSAQGQPVPSTLNVEDWFQFFGINGDNAAALNLDLGNLGGLERLG